MAAKKKGAQLKKLQAEVENEILIRDIYDNAINAEKVTRKDTGLVFDNSMTEHRCLWDPNYPECPERLSKILDRIRQLGLITRCKMIEPRPAEEAELLLKHDKEQIEILKSTGELKDIEKLEKLSSKYDAIYVHPVSKNKIIVIFTFFNIFSISPLFKNKLINPKHFFISKPV